MEVHYQDDTVTLHHGNCLHVLACMPDNSVDAVVTDPPYGLSNTKPQQVADVLKAWVTGDTEAVPAKRGGFMGKDWDSFVPPPAVWAECMRVLKPGGHMAVFAGARTQDIMGLSIRLAGFEIRDTLGWIYGSGFPKSLDVSKAIDRSNGENRARQLEFTEWMRSTGITAREIDEATGTNMGGHYLTAASQPAIATADLFDRLRPLLPEVPERIERLVAERTGIEWTDYVKREVVGKKKSGIAVPRERDRYTVGGSRSVEVDITSSHSDAARRWDGWGTALKPAIEPIILARKPLDGTVAANVLEHGVGGINIDACRVATEDNTQRVSNAGTNGDGWRMGKSYHINGGSPAGRFPANVLLDEHAAREMDEQSGVSKSSIGKPRGAASGDGWGMTATGAEYDDKGGASRFFPVFKYQAKAPTRERPVIEREDGTKIQHPTVKPLELMQWLVRLITPPGGTVLDPFAGSGSTIEAALAEGFRPIGIEMEADYLQLITTRITRGKKRDENTAETLPLGIAPDPVREAE